MKPVLLALTFLSEEHRAQMAEVFEVLYAPDAAQAAAAQRSGVPLLDLSSL